MRKRSNSALSHNSLNPGYWRSTLVLTSVHCSSGWWADSEWNCYGLALLGHLEERTTKPLPLEEATSPHDVTLVQALALYSQAVFPFLFFLTRPHNAGLLTWIGSSVTNSEGVLVPQLLAGLPSRRQLFEVTLPSVFHYTTPNLLLQKNASKFTLHIPLCVEVSKMCQTHLRIVRLSLISFTANH